MSDAVFVEPEPEIEPMPEPGLKSEIEPITEDKPAPKKPRRKKVPMDEETKERLLKQLAKGRETAALNRKKRAEAKKIREAQDAKLEHPVQPAQEDLRKELSEVKLALKELLVAGRRDRSEATQEEPEPVKEAIPPLPTPRIATSRGIKSRWDQYAD